MFSFQLSVMRVVTVVRLVLQLVLVSADPQEPQDDLQDLQPDSDVHSGILADLSQIHLQCVQLLAMVRLQQVSLPLQTIAQRNTLNYDPSCKSFDNKK